MANGSVNLSGRVVDSSGAAKVGLQVDLYTLANYETMIAGGPNTITATYSGGTDAATGRWNFDSQVLTETWVIQVTDGLKKYAIDADNDLQLSELDLVTSLNVNTIYEHTSGSGVTIDGVLIKDGIVTSGGNVLPSSDDAYDLGSATYAWQDLFLEGDITLTDAGSLFVADNSATAFQIMQGSDPYLIIDTANSSESVSIGTGISNTTITLGHGTSTVAVTDNMTVGGDITVTGTTTLNGSLVLGDAAADTLTIGATLQGATPLIFEGANAGGDNDHETSFAITDPTADRTITFPDATLTVNAAADISGTTLASNVVTTSVTTVGVLAGGSIDTSFGTINNNAAITGTAVTGTSLVGGTVAGTTGTFTGVLDVTDATDASDATGDTGALRTEGGASIAKKLYVGSDLNVTGDLTVSGATVLNGAVTLGSDGDDVITINGTIAGANAVVFEGATAGGDANETTLAVVDPDADRTIYMPNQSGYLGVFAADTSAGTISATVGELNLTDGGSSIGTTAVSDGHGILMNHGGTMAQTTVQTLAAYLDDEITAMPNLVTVGTIGSGTWQGTAIASGYIAADAITGAKIADDAIDSEHYAAGSIDNEHLADDAVDSAELADGAVDTAHIADDQVTLAKMAGLARGSIIIGNATGDPTALAVGSNTYVLRSDGTDIAWSVSSDSDTTYTAGDGLDLSGTTFSTDLMANGGLEITSTELSVAKGISEHDVAQFAASVADDDFLRIAGTAVEGLSAAEVAAAIEGSIDAVGTITSGVWNGTAIANGYLANSAVTITAGTGMTGGGSTALGAASTLNVVAGDGITANANDVAITAAQTTVTSMYNAALKIGRDTHNQFDFATDNAIKVSVNAVDDEFRFVAGGNFHADADVFAYSSTTASDRNIKKNIVKISDALSKVKALHGVTFDYKEEHRGSSVGLIAQDVQALYPELVTQAPKLGTDDEAYLSLNYNGVIGLLVEAVKELAEEVRD